MKVINVLGLFCLSLCTGCESEQQEKQQEVKPVKVEVMRISNSQFIIKSCPLRVVPGHRA